MVDHLPKRLTHDAILEAIVEVRFETKTSVVPEMMFGRVAEREIWKDFRPARLPGADIPSSIRRSDPALMYQPAIELTSPDGGVRIRIGANSFAYARIGPYPGWEGKMGIEVDGAVDHLFERVPDIQVSRLGLRYMNALRSDLHGIRSLDDLAIRVQVSNEDVSNSLNLNFNRQDSEEMTVTCRVATVDLARGPIPESASIITDIDVYTPNSFSTKDSTAVKKWISQAHIRNKANFFRLLGTEATQRLREDK